MPSTTHEQDLAQIARLEQLGREAERQVVSAMSAEYYFDQARRMRAMLEPTS